METTTPMAHGEPLGVLPDPKRHRTIHAYEHLSNRDLVVMTHHYNDDTLTWECRTRSHWSLLPEMVDSYT